MIVAQSLSRHRLTVQFYLTFVRPALVNQRHIIPGSTACRYGSQSLERLNPGTVDQTRSSRTFKSDQYVLRRVRFPSASAHNQLTTDNGRPSLSRYNDRAQQLSKTTRDTVLQLYQDDLDGEDTKAYLRDLVDLYGDAVVLREPFSTQSTHHAHNAARKDANGPPVHSGPSFERKQEHQTQSIIRDFRYLLKDETTAWRAIWSKYLELDEPRIERIPDGLLRNILRHFGTSNPGDLEIKSGELRTAYFTLIDDMARAKIRIWRKDWNTAAHLALRSQDTIDQDALDYALRMWYMMENKYHCRADSVTFTILYLASAKAQKFGVADRLWREMQARGLPVDRLARIAEITVGGLRRNRSAVTNAYVALVEDGHAVDMSILDNVIKAFVSAGEVSAAEEVLRRVKSIHQQSSATSLVTVLRDWREARAVNKLLKKSTSLPPAAQRQLQAILHSHMIPSERTYRPLINYYSIRTGEFDRVKGLLQEMAETNITLSQAIFFIIFKGFVQNVPSGRKNWSPDALNDIATAFQQQLGANADFTTMDSKLPMMAIEAFCALDMIEEARVMWDLITQRWEAPAWTTAKVHAMIGQDMLAKKLSTEYGGELGSLFSADVAHQR